MTEVVPLNTVKGHLSELVSRVGGQHERITVTVQGRPSAVIIAPDDLEALEETIAVLADSELVSQLATADAELTRGEGETVEQLAQALRAGQASA